MRRCSSSLALIFIVLATSLAYADSRRVLDYTYDGAGNIIRIESSASENPPSIDSIVPDAVRRNASTSVTVTGNDLRLVEVTPTDSAVTVSNVQSTQTFGDVRHRVGQRSSAWRQHTHFRNGSAGKSRGQTP